MDTISLKIPITIKAKLTDKLRGRIVNELNESLKRVEMELGQINIEERKVLAEQGHNDIQRMQAIRAHFDQERQERAEFKEATLKRLEDTNHLAPGAEIIQGQLERIVEVKIGDNIREIMNVEILVEDDKVVAIRS